MLVQCHDMHTMHAHLQNICAYDGRQAQRGGGSLHPHTGRAHQKETAANRMQTQDPSAITSQAYSTKKAEGKNVLAQHHTPELLVHTGTAASGSIKKIKNKAFFWSFGTSFGSEAVQSKQAGRTNRQARKNKAQNKSSSLASASASASGAL